MENEGLIAAVQLSDREEFEQPDPLYVSKNELAGLTWRHFATLLKSLYDRPPDAVRVKYMDNEGDWVELGSDAELQEALKLTSGLEEILQLQVRRVDTERLIELSDECTDCEPMSNTSSQDGLRRECLDGRLGVDVRHGGNDFMMYIPTTDPGGDALPVLRYPLPTFPDQVPLVYPSSGSTNSMPAPPFVAEGPLVPEPATIPATSLTPALSMDEASVPTEVPTEPLAQAKIPSAPEGVLYYPHQYQVLRAPVASISRTMFDQAAELSSEEKIQFLKNIAQKHHQQQKKQDSTAVLPEVERLCSDFSPHSPCLGKNSIPNQDPFDVDGASASPTSAPSSANFKRGESVEILTPTRVDISCGGSPHSLKLTRSSSVDPNSSNSLSPNSSLGQGLPLVLDPPQPRRSVSADKSATSKVAATKALYNSAVVPKAKLPKKADSGAPVPMPRNLLMMEGAQSGANAVAIEMPSEPESYHGAASNKEEEIAASGGASSTSASEETGEILARGGSVAASMDGEIKSNTQADSCAVAPVTSDTITPKEGAVTLKELAKRAGKPKSSPAKKVKVLEKKSDGSAKMEVKKEDTKKTETFGVGARPKVIEKRGKKKAEDSQTKRKTPEKEEKLKEGEIEPLKDEESGETAVMGGSSNKEISALKYDDFLKHLKKVKKDLHSSIVKDVTKETDKLLRKSLTRSRSESHDVEFRFCNVKGRTDSIVHKGITCDHCDHEIVGVRYKCGNCPDFDLCERCEYSEFVHDPTHVFLKLRKPARKAGCVGKERIPLLRENIYEAEKAWEEKKKEKEEKKKAMKKEKEEKKREKKEKRKSADKEGDDVKRDEIIFRRILEEKQSAESEKKRYWSPCRMSPLNISSPADVQEGFDLWQEKDTTEAAETIGAFQVMMEAHLNKTSVSERADEETQKSESDGVAPVQRERLASDSSGSSIVRLSSPLPVIISEPPSQAPEQVTTVVLLPSEGRELVEVEEPIVCDIASADEAKNDIDRESMRVQVPKEWIKDDDEEDDDACSFVSGSSYEYFHSDDSEEFCILTPPLRDEYEQIGQEEAEEEEDVAGGDRAANVANGEQMDQQDEQKDNDGADDVQVSERPAESGEQQQAEEEEAVLVSLGEDENNNEEVLDEEGTGEEPQGELPKELAAAETECEVHWTQLVHNLTDKEKALYEQMLHTELDREKSAEKLTTEKNDPPSREEMSQQCLKIQAEKEKEAWERSKMQVAREEDYKEILEVKAMQASLVNRQLEETGQTGVAGAVAAHRLMASPGKVKVSKKPKAHQEQEEENSEQASCRALNSEDQDKVPRKAQVESTSHRNMTRNKHLKEMLELEEQKFAALNAGDHEAVAQIELRLKELDQQKQTDANKVELVGAQQQQKASSETSSSSDGKEEESPVGSLRVSGQTSLVSSSTQSCASEKVDAASVTPVTFVKDADCQTVPEPMVQASHIIQNVASGVSKAASTAFSTAKDVFYSLQAKQNEKKSSAQSDKSEVTNQRGGQEKPRTAVWTPSTPWEPKESMWTPPNSTWTPPNSTWTPPKSDWKPPTSTWTPPEPIYRPPVSNWVPPPSAYSESSQVDETGDQGGAPARVEAEAKNSATEPVSRSNDGSPARGSEVEAPAKRGSTSSSSSLSSAASVLSLQQSSPIASLNIADSALRREMQGMQRLIEMGFANREKNRQLLAKFDSDLERVVQSLLQEEGEDHWAFHRH